MYDDRMSAPVGRPPAALPPDITERLVRLKTAEETATRSSAARRQQLRTEVADLLDGGHSAAAIARALGVSRQAVHKITHPTS